MKTKRNKKQKNRSFRKNRSFKKKGLKKNPTRKNVGGHLMGFEVGREFELPANSFKGGDYAGVEFYFKAHSFKHIDSFELLTPEHDSIIYPICQANNRTKNVEKCGSKPINVTPGTPDGDYNIDQYSSLAERMFGYMGKFLNMDTVIDWVKKRDTFILAKMLSRVPANEERAEGTKSKDHKWFEIPLAEGGRKIQLVIERVSARKAIVWQLSHKQRNNQFFTGEDYAYPTAKFNLIVNGDSSDKPIDIVIGTPIDIIVEIFNTVKSSTVAGRPLSFGNVEIYNTTGGPIQKPALQRYDVTNTNQIFNYINNNPDIKSLRIVANIKTYYDGKITTKIQDINITPLPPPPPPDDLSGFTFGDATLLANSPNKNVVGTRVAADNGRRILIEKWRIGMKEEKLGEYPLADPSINIEIDPTKHIELRAYAINAANVKSNGYEARDYEFDYIKSADIVKAVQGDSVFTSMPITHVVNGDMITMRVNFKIINKRLLFFYCYTAEENNGDYVFDRPIENGQPTLDFQINTPDINNRFVKFLFCMKEGPDENTDGIDRTDLSSYKELIIPLLSANAIGENEDDVKCVISGATQNAISAQLKQNGELKGNQPILENNQTYRFPGLNRGLGDAQNSYFVTVNGNNERKITLPVSCHALEGEAVERANSEERRIAEEARKADVARSAEETRLAVVAAEAEVARLNNDCKTYKIGDVQIFKTANIRIMNKKIESMETEKVTRLREIIRKAIIRDDDCDFIFQELFKDLNVSLLVFKGLIQPIKIDIIKCINHKLTIPAGPQ